LATGPKQRLQTGPVKKIKTKSAIGFLAGEYYDVLLIAIKAKHIFS
jgi:hypothetical protein